VIFPSSSLPAIRFTNVSRHFGEVKAVDNVTLDVYDGEFFTMLGPSGSGKTTCLRMIAGFDEPSSGSIQLHGQEVAGLPPYERDVNTVFQDYALFPHMTIGDNIAYGLMIRKVPRAEREKRVQEMLNLVRLPEIAQRRPSQLSGGQRQRVALARALINRPRVLLLDEPLGALDLKLRQQMQVELKIIQKEVGITFIFVTHDQEEALVMSDRVAVINHGHLEQVGTGEEIYERPRTLFVADFMGVENFFEVHGAAATLEGARFEMEGGQALWASNSPDFPQNSPATLAVRPECVRLTRNPPSANGGALNVLEGELVESIYEGGSRRWVVRISSGQRLVVRDASAPHGSPPTGETKVYVSWEPARSLVYPRGGTSER
jgi:putative spermidine/putrescine transport system ATP-binding protein